MILNDQELLEFHFRGSIGFRSLDREIQETGLDEDLQRILDVFACFWSTPSSRDFEEHLQCPISEG